MYEGVNLVEMSKILTVRQTVGDMTVLLTKIALNFRSAVLRRNMYENENWTVNGRIDHQEP